MELLKFNHIEICLLASTGLFLLIQILYYTTLYNRISRNNKHIQKNEPDLGYPPVSVIIFAKDELANLRENLPHILAQNYQKFEVIVINDNPTDGSDDYLKLLENEHKNLYHSFTPDSSRYISHKKLGITLGIKASKYDWLVFTEANCKPASVNWLKCIADNFTPGTEIVLGGYGYAKGSKWMNKKISFDTLFSSIRVLGSALAGKPFAASGRNMAYMKELFFRNKGFSRHLNLQRGDDDLFINQVATKQNTRVETRAESMVWMKPLDYAKPWKEDKLNHVMTSRLYKGGQKYLLGLETLSRLLFYLAVAGCIGYGVATINFILMTVGVLAWGIRYGIQLSVINTTSKSIGDQERYYLSLPVFDFLQPLQSLRFRLQCRFRGRNEFMRR